MPELKEPRFFARELPRQAHRTALPRDTLEEYLALFARRGPGSWSARRSALVPAVGERGARHRRGAAGRADRRDPARAGELPALAAPADACSTQSRARRDLATALAWRSGAPVGGSRRCRRRRCCATPSASATSSSCAATASVFRAEQVLVLIYDDFRADNDATVRPRAALPRRRRHVGSRRTRPTPRCACAPSGSTSGALVAVGRGPFARVAKTSIKALAPRRVRRGALRGVQRRLISPPRRRWTRR